MLQRISVHSCCVMLLGALLDISVMNNG